MEARKKNREAKKKYIEAVHEFRDLLLTNPDTLNKVQDLINQKGKEYFSKPTGGKSGSYQDGEIELMKGDDGKSYIEILNKKEFIKRIKKEQGYENNNNNNNNNDGDDEDFDEAAFDDAFRHAIFVDISDKENPKLVDVPSKLLSKRSDWVLKWKKVEEIPKAFPEGNIIAIHADTADNIIIFFPIPTIASGGSITYKKARKMKKTRKMKKNRT